MKILIIDTNEGLREFLQMEFVSIGHEVKTTNSVDYAYCTIWNDFLPDYVLCGATPLEGEDVLQFLLQIRSEYGNGPLLIIMSMNSPFLDTNVYIEYGANKFIDKFNGLQQIIDSIN